MKTHDARGILAAICLLGGPAPAPAEIVSRTLLDKADVKAMRDSRNNAWRIWISPDGTRFSYRLCDNGYQLYENGKVVGKGFVTNVVYSPDGKRMAYGRSATEGVDERFPGRMSSTFELSDDNGVFCAKVFDTSVIVAGDYKQHHVTSQPETLAFSPDGRHFAYQASKTTPLPNDRYLDEQRVFIDGKEWDYQGRYDGLASVLGYSPDGRLATVVRRDNKLLWVVGGVDQSPKGHISVGGEFAFSPDGKRFAYDAVKGEKEVLVLDGVESPPHDGPVGSLIFSPDGKRFAYRVIDGATETMSYVVDGVKGPAYTGVMGLAFSPDGTRYAHVAMQREPDGSYANWIVANGKKLGENSSVQYMDVAKPLLAFSPDGKHIAHIGKPRDGMLGLYEDGALKNEFPADGILSYIAYFPGANRTIFFAYQGPDMFAVIDGKPQPKNGYVAILPNSRVYFDGPNAFHYLALAEAADNPSLQEIYLVRETLPGAPSAAKPASAAKPGAKK